MSHHDPHARTARVFTTRQQENEAAFAALAALEPRFVAAVDQLSRLLAAGGMLMFCGNGGSGSSASHMVNDCVGHMYIDRPPIRAVSLVDNTSVLTAVSNDYGYEHIFERQLLAVGRPGDALIAISTSGNSENVVRAATAARERGIAVVALTDRRGGKLRELADHWLFADTENPVCAEHVHLFLLHTLTEALESVLHGDHPSWGQTGGPL